MNEPTLTKLSDKAISVKLTIRRASLVTRDTSLTTALQAQENDTSLMVTSRLFRDKFSPVCRIMQAVREVYAYHRTNTLPYVDSGPRLLPSALYFDYQKDMRHRIAVVDTLMKQWMPRWSALVSNDIAYRNHGQAVSRAAVDDYPTEEQFTQKMAFDLSFTPLPDENHPLFDLSEDDKKSFQTHVQEVVANARTDVLQRMLKPIAHLVEKLSIPLEDQKRWHNSALENVIEGCRTARKLMIEDNPALVAEIDELERQAVGYAFNSTALKEQPEARVAAAEKFTAAAKKMEAYF